ncbi:MAG: hypothetical protein QOG15_2049 [Solirubrobacteraceae bacterium]|nr:hypothetical protein [Solirubrobacteraceae bacterium]
MALCLTVGALGVLVGWLLVGGGRIEVKADGLDRAIAIGTIATAVGTLALAAATFSLAMKTRDVVRASQDEASAARDAVKVGTEQAAIATAALDAQTQPFLTVGTRKPEVMNFDSVHVRNAGPGTAIVTRAVFVSSNGDVTLGAAYDPVIPPGESSSILRQGPFIPSGAPSREQTFSAAIEYSDVSGRVRGAVRLDLHKPDGQLDAYGDGPRLRVRQVFWADTLDEVRERPMFGSQPMY